MPVAKTFFGGQWSSVTSPLGPTGLDFIGEWDATTEYAYPNAVFYNGGTWVAVYPEPFDTVAPSLDGEEPYWMPLSLPGVSEEGSGVYGPVLPGIRPIPMDDELGRTLIIDGSTTGVGDQPPLVNRGWLRLFPTGSIILPERMRLSLRYGFGKAGDRLQVWHEWNGSSPSAGPPYEPSFLYFELIDEDPTEQVILLANKAAPLLYASPYRTMTVTKLYSSLTTYDPELETNVLTDVWLLEGNNY